MYHVFNGNIFSGVSLIPLVWTFQCFLNLQMLHGTIYSSKAEHSTMCHKFILSEGFFLVVRERVAHIVLSILIFSEWFATGVDHQRVDAMNAWVWVAHFMSTWLGISTSLLWVWNNYHFLLYFFSFLYIHHLFYFFSECAMPCEETFQSRDWQLDRDANLWRSSVRF